MTCAYMPDGATFNGQKNVLPGAYFATLKPGDLLGDEKQNLLVWSNPTRRCQRETARQTA